MRRLLPKFAVLAAVCVLSACASTPRPLPRLGEDARSSLGTVGVITIGPAVGGKVDGPVGVGKEAVVGALEGAAIGTPSGIVAGALLGLICGPGAFICVPVGAASGGLLGLVGGGTAGGIVKGNRAIPESAASGIQMALTSAIAAHDLQADLRQRVLQRAGNAAMTIDLGAGATVPVASPDYASFAGRGVGSVLEMSLTQLAFTGEGGKNPTLAVVITARARLIRIADKRVLWNVEQVRYESLAAAFFFWTTRDSDLLKTEIDNGLEALARQMSEALFVADTCCERSPTRYSVLQYRYKSGLKGPLSGTPI